MVTANPARLLGLSMAAGRESLRRGVAANMTMYRRSEETGNVEVVRTVLAGTVVYEAAGAGPSRHRSAPLDLPRSGRAARPDTLACGTTGERILKEEHRACP